MKYTTVKARIRKLDPALDPTDEAFRIAALLLSALQVGTDPLALAAYTGESVEWITQVAERLHTNGVWTDDGKTACDWFDTEHGGVAFWVDVRVGQGLLERSTS